MQQRQQDDKAQLIPKILNSSPIIVPIKVDLTQCGARYVDSFCWDLNSSSWDNFAATTASDIGLPPIIQVKLGHSKLHYLIYTYTINFAYFF